MKKYYAKKGEIPEQGEVWLPKGQKRHLMALHLVDIKNVRRYVPDQLDIISVFPGKTFAATLLSYYGPKSTLEYHELFIMPAWIKVNGLRGFWVSHAYVDNKKSIIGGQKNFGLPKEMAQFDWAGHQPDTAVISQNGSTLIEVHYSKAFGALRFPINAEAISILKNQVMYISNRFYANYGLCCIEYNFPKESPISEDMSEINLGKSILAVSGENMEGYMAETTQVAAFLKKTTINNDHEECK